MKKLTLLIALGLLSGASVAAQAASINLGDCDGNGTACPFVTYGDGQSYALGVNAVLYDFAQGGGTGPGNPFYVNSTPGAIKDLTVVATGASGSPVNTNYAGADNAYPTPNSSGASYFSTGTVADPGGSGEFTGDAAGTWDVSLSALEVFLDSESLVFFFNNNQVNSGASTNQNLAAWMQVTIRDGSGNVVSVYDLTNNNSKYALAIDGGGGVLNGNPGAYTHSGPLDSPIAGTNAATDYILSGGLLCYNLPATPVSCSGPHDKEINQNLGANQAAYAIVFPELNAQLATLFSGDVTGYSMNVDLRLGCDPSIGTSSAICVGRSLNNGYEQLFIGTAATVQTPEPATMALFGMGLIGLFGVTRRRQILG